MLIVAGILGLVNALLGTVLRILSIPFLIVTLGLFAIVINMAVLWVTTMLTDRIEIDGFWAYFWAALIISIVSLVLRIAFRKAPIREVIGLAAIGTLANAALDRALPNPVDTMFDISFC